MRLALVFTLFIASSALFAHSNDEARLLRLTADKIAKVKVGQEVLVIANRAEFEATLHPSTFPKDVETETFPATILSVVGHDVTVQFVGSGEALTVNVLDILLPVETVAGSGETVFKINDRIDVVIIRMENDREYDYHFALGTVVQLYDGLMGARGESVVLVRFNEREEYPKQQAYFVLTDFDRLYTPQNVGCELELKNTRKLTVPKTRRERLPI